MKGRTNNNAQKEMVSQGREGHTPQRHARPYSPNNESRKLLIIYSKIFFVVSMLADSNSWHK